MIFKYLKWQWLQTCYNHITNSTDLFTFFLFVAIFSIFCCYLFFHAVFCLVPLIMSHMQLHSFFGWPEKRVEFYVKNDFEFAVWKKRNSTFRISVCVWCENLVLVLYHRLNTVLPFCHAACVFTSLLWQKLCYKTEWNKIK